ncbi:MAG: N-acetyltransferase family protein [Halolamina sp.]
MPSPASCWRYRCEAGMIREARPADRPAIERLQEHLPEPATGLLDDVAGGEILVSTAPGPGGADIPVGYLLWFPGTPVYAAELVVAPEYRREGRGKRLFRALFERLPQGTAVELLVAADNEAAQRLYRQLGFERVAIEPDAYESGEGYRMRAVVRRDRE